MKQPTINHAVVTGGAGFIGSNIANNLVNAGVDVTVVDDFSLGTRDNLGEAVTVHDESVVTYDRLSENTDVVYHLAALSSLPMHEGNAQDGCRVNVEGFVNIAEQARKANATLVYASTSSVYGTHSTPTQATQTVESQTAYEASKLARERYAQYYANYHDMQTVGLRLFSIYQGMAYREGHKQQFANVISQFAEQLHNGETPVIYGDGTQTRDFTHISDAVRAFHAALDADSGVYNVGSQTVYSFNEVVTALNKRLQTEIEPEYVDNPIPSDVYVGAQYSSSARLERLTGWEPQVSFADGLDRVCAAYPETDDGHVAGHDGDQD